MRIGSAIILSLSIHSLLVMPLFAENETIIKSRSFSISKIEIMPSKMNEKVIETSRKTFHGNIVKRRFKKKINKKSLKGNIAASKYLKLVREIVIKNYMSSSKARKMKLKGEVMANIQIQESGRFDIMSIQGKNNILQKLTFKTFEKISTFPPIPKDSGQTEVFLKIPIQYDFR